MPAVQLERLKLQINLLVQHFTSPVDFCRALRDLFELYADRVYRPGQTVQSRSLIPTYHLPELVMRQVQISLAPLVTQNPPAALILADALWSQTYLETRSLGAILLGLTPLESAEAVTERLRTWAAPDLDRKLLAALLSAGSHGLRQRTPAVWLGMIETWLDSSTPAGVEIGLLALLPFINDPNNANLPPAFRLTAHLFKSPPPALQGVLQDVLLALGRRSPQETAFFLRQVLSAAPPPATLRMARRVLPLLPAASQTSLRSLLQSTKID